MKLSARGIHLLFSRFCFCVTRPRWFYLLTYQLVKIQKKCNLTKKFSVNDFTEKLHYFSHFIVSSVCGFLHIYIFTHLYFPGWKFFIASLLSLTKFFWYPKNRRKCEKNKMIIIIGLPSMYLFIHPIFVIFFLFDIAKSEGNYFIIQISYVWDLYISTYNLRKMLLTFSLNFWHCVNMFWKFQDIQAYNNIWNFQPCKIPCNVF